MKSAWCHRHVSGGVASFFLMGAPNYQGPEFDIEFLLNHQNEVTFTDHPLGGTGATTFYNLEFRSHRRLPYLRH